MQTQEYIELQEHKNRLRMLINSFDKNQEKIFDIIRYKISKELHEKIFKKALLDEKITLDDVESLRQLLYFN